MITTDDIRKMMERFFDGDTTLDEERTLYDYFASENVDPTLLQFKEMFRDFGSLPYNEPQAVSTDERRTAYTPTRQKTHPDKDGKQESIPILKKKTYHWHWAVAAAIILAVFFAGSVAYRSYREHQLYNLYGGSYMIVHGERIDDLNRIRHNIEQTLAQAETAEHDFDTYDIIHQAENELLSDISDNAEREEIIKLLNE